MVYSSSLKAFLALVGESISEREIKRCMNLRSVTHGDNIMVLPGTR